jgi:hypothetical protein
MAFVEAYRSACGSGKSTEIGSANFEVASQLSRLATNKQ